MRFERGIEMKIDLNSDLGESFGAYTIGRDEEVLSYVSSANVACGFHAGDPTVMFHTVRLAKERGVSIGAHPGLPDLVGFGRRKMAISRRMPTPWWCTRWGPSWPWPMRKG